MEGRLSTYGLRIRELCDEVNCGGHSHEMPASSFIKLVFFMPFDVLWPVMNAHSVLYSVCVCDLLFAKVRFNTIFWDPSGVPRLLYFAVKRSKRRNLTPSKS